MCVHVHVYIIADNCMPAATGNCPPCSKHSTTTFLSDSLILLSCISNTVEKFVIGTPSEESKIVVDPTHVTFIWKHELHQVLWLLTALLLICDFCWIVVTKCHPHPSAVGSDGFDQFCEVQPIWGRQLFSYFFSRVWNTQCLAVCCMSLTVPTSNQAVNTSAARMHWNSSRFLFPCSAFKRLTSSAAAGGSVSLHRKGLGSRSSPSMLWTWTTTRWPHSRSTTQMPM